MAHVKDKKITILNEQETGEMDEYGDPIKAWLPISGGANIWAYFRHLSGNEFFGAMMVNSKEEVLFEINWRNDIETYMRIEYKGKQYRITRIDNYEGYKNDLKIYAYNLNGE
jgi:SPP1 family predicted phage head-tail adaptor